MNRDFQSYINQKASTFPDLLPTVTPKNLVMIKNPPEQLIVKVQEGKRMPNEFLHSKHNLEIKYCMDFLLL